VTKILESLGINDETPLFEVLNKTDLLEPEDKEAVETQAARSETVFAVSSITGDGLESLLAAVAEALQASAKTEALSLTFAEGRKRAWLFAQGVVEDERQTDEGYTLKVRWTRKQSEQFARL
jgi:GTP-binding protein HflX